MEWLNVRINSISIKNCKNVKNGNIVLGEDKNNIFNQASILGLYGQNGSGKTTLIQVIDVIKTLMMGRPLPSSLIHLVNSDEKNCEINIEFIMSDCERKVYKVEYFVQLKIEDENIENILEVDNHSFDSKRKKIVVSKEVLTSSYLENNVIKVRKADIISMNNSSDSIFLPESKLNILTHNSLSAQDDLRISKKMSYESSRSFIFSVHTLKIFREECHEKYYIDILENLVRYANFNLFVIGTKDIGLINLNVALPFNFRIKEKTKGFSLGHVAIDLRETSSISPDVYNVVKKTIKSMNVVLSQIVPNLKVLIEEVGRMIDENGKESIQVQLFSQRNDNTKISLKYESEGIKKIISILQLLIVIYNNPSTTVAIDELDSGIFEYLLGEILKIISQSAKGQLIFSSHNLRPLETIDKKFVYFTTTNSENRYIKMMYISQNNNLRNFYFHELLLGGQSEELYEQTNNGAIALAFKEAGDFIE